MNQDEIIRMAREVNLHWYVNELNEEHFFEILKRFAVLIAATEREACAKVAAWILKMPENDVSAAIRARRQE
jgi:hypothetical protein